jgi:hypothetical protein
MFSERQQAHPQAVAGSAKPEILSQQLGIYELRRTFAVPSAKSAGFNR